MSVSIQTTADPCTDLSGYMAEVIEGIKRLGTAGVPVTTPALAPTTVPIVDCPNIVRDTIEPSPLFTDASIECAWTQGRIGDDKVLALGRRADNTVWSCVFTLNTRSWSDAQPVPDLTGVGLGATAQHTGYAVFGVARFIKMFKVDDDTLNFVCEVELPRIPVAMAVSEDGQLVAVIMDDQKELWVFRCTAECLALVQTLPAGQNHLMLTLAFNPSGTHLAVSDATNRIVVFGVNTSELSPIAEPVGQLSMMPTGADLLTHYAEKNKAPEFEQDEPALWIALGENTSTGVLATQHHLALAHHGRRHFIMDKGYAVATFVHDQFWALLDAAGMVVLRDYEDNVRQSLAPEQRGRPHVAYAMACPCESCPYRSRQPPSTLSRPVLWLTPDGATLVVVDQWSVARVAVASAGNA